MKASLRFKLLITLCILAISGLATAQDPSGDPPSRAARLQYIDGQVSLQPGGVDDWVEASLNRPLTNSDRIWTDRDSRAEVTIASAALRMGSETSVTISNLNDNTFQIELDQGTMNLSVRYLNAGEIVEVDTPNFAYTVFQPGNYRFDVMPDDDQSWISVRSGDGEATGQGNAVRVRRGERFSFSSGQSLSYASSGLPHSDGFDDWCAVRERRETSSPSAGYVAAGTIGYEDLDDNGAWEPTPVYGTVWYPRVHPGWAPYREGHWAWVEPWGWTWVDDARWGFAPFHYGRWVFVGDRWGWVPGPTGVRPVYAPALVAWVGGVSIGVGGGVAWVPLGWHDPFIPAYHVSPAYARNVNISNSRVVNVTVINNYYTTNNVTVRNTTINNIHYENVRVNGAVTGVPQNAFASGKPVGRIGMPVPAGAMARSNMMAGAAVVPTREAVLGGHAPMGVPQRVIAPRQVASRVAPPPRPVSFEQQRPLLQKSNGVPLSPEIRSNLQKSAPAPVVRGGQPAGNPQAGRPPMQNPGGNQSFGRSGNSSASQPTMRPTPTQPTATPTNAAPNANRQTTQPPAPTNANVPVRNVPRPPQPGANTNSPATHTGENQPNTQRPGVWTNDNIRRAPNSEHPTAEQSGGQTQTPARTNSYSGHDQTPAPPQQRTASPAQVQSPHTLPTPAPAVAPARTATPAPAPQKRTPPPPPPAKENRDKDRDTKGH